MSGNTTPPPPESMLLTGRLGMQLVRQTAGSWWVFMLRGVAAIIFGLLVFLFPGLGLVFILAFLGAWMLFDGMGSIYQAVKGGHPTGERSRTWLWIDGIISLVAAAVILLAPGVSAIGLLIVTAAWFLLSGGARLMLAFRLSSVLLGLLGALNIVIGAWMLLRPGPGLLAVIWMVALEAIIMGAIMISLGWRLKHIHQNPEQEAGQTRI
ncbi:MAG: HdeD family acid-resistance protein [Alphaproteobacteria bacterium]|jgi:uncharacterized membrane protein HdeD (DUF308 family)